MFKMHKWLTAPCTSILCWKEVSPSKDRSSVSFYKGEKKKDTGGKNKSSLRRRKGAFSFVFPCLFHCNSNLHTLFFQRREQVTGKPVHWYILNIEKEKTKPYKTNQPNKTTKNTTHLKQTNKQIIKVENIQRLSALLLERPLHVRLIQCSSFYL